jgi:hypothetical protein
MADLCNSFFDLNFKRRVRYLIILICFLTSLPLIYYNLSRNQINWEIMNESNKNLVLKSQTHMENGDSALPEITIITPLNNSYYNNPPLVQINVNDTYEINQSWYLIIGSGENKTFPGNSVEIDMNLWQMQPEGIVVIRFYVNNSIGKEGFSDLQIIKDAIRPTITIHSPRNGTIVTEEPPDFNISISDVNFHKFWFKFNSSDECYFWKVSLGNTIVWLPFSEWRTIPQGYLLVTFFVNDTAGNINSVDIMIIKQITDTHEKEIPGINSPLLFLVLIITSTVIVIGSIRKIQN